MSDQNWRPINAEDDGCAVLITYRNEAGEEHVHVADSWGVDLDSSIFHTLCWRQCSGDWPGCKSNCPLFTGPVTECFICGISVEQEYIRKGMALGHRQQMSMVEGLLYYHAV